MTGRMIDVSLKGSMTFHRSCPKLMDWIGSSKHKVGFRNFRNSISSKSMLTAFIVISTSQNCHGKLILHFVTISHKLSRKSIKTKVYTCDPTRQELQVYCLFGNMSILLKKCADNMISLKMSFFAALAF